MGAHRARELARRGGLVVRRSHGLRFGRAALPQVDREDRERADREKLGLPVLKRLLPEVGIIDRPLFDEMAVVGVKEAAMHLDERIPLSQRQIGRAGKVFAVEPVTIPGCMQ